jgi:hypothetical protein
VIQSHFQVALESHPVVAQQQGIACLCTVIWTYV